jgi:hypothetical protein
MPSRQESDQPLLSIKVFEHGGRVERLGQANHAFIKQQRPIRMIGNEPVVLEKVRVRLPFAQQSSRVLRTPPAGGFLSDTFDVLKQAHAAAVTAWRFRNLG